MRNNNNKTVFSPGSLYKIKNSKDDSSFKNIFCLKYNLFEKSIEEQIHLGYDTVVYIGCECLSGKHLFFQGNDIFLFYNPDIEKRLQLI